ncbi:ATP-grasp domain-containing protein [Alicyclobacillus sendaiensis]|nr:hypothetical protein [Alicyclobacillus sendaiensis]
MGNHVLFANGFLQRGWDVYYGHVNSISTANYKVFCDIAPVVEIIQSNSIDVEIRHECIEKFDLVWVMNQPHPSLEKEVWQILWMLSQRCTFVNSVESMLFLNNKNNLGQIIPLEHLVESYASNDFEYLWSIYQSRINERWIVKPPNGGCGSDVFLLEPGQSNSRAILQSMTGNSVSKLEMGEFNLIGLQNKYCILQRYATSVNEGEKRVILAGGAIIAQHGRRSAPGDHRSNLTLGGELVSASLTKDESQLCLRLAQNFLNYGIRFAGIDMSYPYVLEVNIVNPGGLYDVLSLTGIDYTSIAIDNILSTCGHSLADGLS